MSDFDDAAAGSRCTEAMDTGTTLRDVELDAFVEHLPLWTHQHAMLGAADNLDDYKRKNANQYFPLCGIDPFANISLYNQFTEIIEDIGFHLGDTAEQQAIKVRAVRRMCKFNQVFSALRFVVRQVADNNRRIQNITSGNLTTSDLGPPPTGLPAAASFQRTSVDSDPGRVAGAQDPNVVLATPPASPEPAAGLRTPLYDRTANDDNAIGGRRNKRKQPYPTRVTAAGPVGPRGRYFKQIKPLLTEFAASNAEPVRNQAPLGSFEATPCPGPTPKKTGRRSARSGRFEADTAAANERDYSQAYTDLTSEDISAVLAAPAGEVTQL